MRRLLRKIIQILDGTPADYGLHSRGQSMAELALVTPILIVLIMGLVEIGWFANNYMILLEVTRTGARFGTVQTGNNSPLAWDNKGSWVPSVTGFFPPDTETDLQRIGVRNCNAVASTQAYQGFYSLLNCVMLQSLDPLEFRRKVAADDPDSPDDVVISVFALQLVDPNAPFFQNRPNYKLASVPGVPDNLPRVVVVGRYPTNANECNITAEGNGTPDVRDPFDYLSASGGASGDGVRNYVVQKDPVTNVTLPDVEENRLYLELLGGDPYNGANSNSWEKQRGFVYAGQHYVSTSGKRCLGSEFTISDVEGLVNLPGFNLTDERERKNLASMGMVLVEMFWRHELLLKNPVFNPVFTILGDDTIIAVWAAFPVPAVEPRIRFPE